MRTSEGLRDVETRLSEDSREPVSSDSDLSITMGEGSWLFSSTGEVDVRYSTTGDAGTSGLVKRGMSKIPEGCAKLGSFGK